MSDLTPDLTPEDLYASWAFQDKFAEIALNLVEYGAHLGALSLARQILNEQAENGNRTLRVDEIKILIEKAKIEIRTEAEQGIKNARGS
jgi:hypothetical protein